MGGKNKQWRIAYFLLVLLLCCGLTFSLGGKALAATATECTDVLPSGYLSTIQSALQSHISGGIDFTANSYPAALFKSSGQIILYMTYGSGFSNGTMLLEDPASDSYYIKIHSNSGSVNTVKAHFDLTTAAWVSGSSSSTSGTTASDAPDCYFGLEHSTNDTGVSFSPALDTLWPQNPGQTYSGVSFHTAPTVPSSPVLSGTAGFHQNVINWTTPANGGSSITGYTLRDGSTVIYTGSANTFTETGLTTGTTYTYTVKATNAIGDSSWSGSFGLAPAAYVNPSPGTGDGITYRDEELLALGITGFLSYKIAMGFRWRMSR